MQLTQETIIWIRQLVCANKDAPVSKIITHFEHEIEDVNNKFTIGSAIENLNNMILCKTHSIQSKDRKIRLLLSINGLKLQDCVKPKLILSLKNSLLIISQFTLKPYKIY